MVTDSKGIALRIEVVRWITLEMSRCQRSEQGKWIFSPVRTFQWR